MLAAEGGTPSHEGNAKTLRLSGFMYRIEQRPIGGPTRRKYWFALSDETPYLYWYKNKTDLNCVGKIALSGSAFTFDPREKNRFEIHVNNENHLLETADSKTRDMWLRNLQNNRRRLYERENVENIAKVEIISQESYSTLANPLAQPPREHFGTELAEEVIAPGPSDEKNLEEEIVEATMSTFYLDANGELNPHSLEIPSPSPPNQDILRAAEDFIAKVTQNRDISEPAKKALNKARTSFRFPTFSIGSGGKSCENCKNLIEFVDKLKERCYELTDSVSAHQELANTLRASLMVSTNQRLALEQQFKNSSIPSEHVQFVLNYEENLTALQLNATEQNREIQNLRKANKELADRNSELFASIDAYRDALRTKEEVILRMADGDNREAPPPEVNYDDVAEALLVEGDDSSVQQAQEDSVADLNELRDLVEGYKAQNLFLNNEIIELQLIGQRLEDREEKTKKQNFELEARFYRLKSKYLMLLNHIKSAKKLSASTKPLILICPIAILLVNVEAVMHDLFAEVNNVGILPHREGDTEIGNSSILDRTSAEGDTIDALGFYLPESGLNVLPNDERQHENMVDRAMDLSKKSENIMSQIDSERSEKYQNWLVKWDSFLVNHASKPLVQSPELKALVRTGVPTTYRSRIWKSLLQLWTQVQQDDAGYGYYDCLVKKANTCDPDDSCIKQIDLDVSRTLPTNKYFDDPSSEKIAELKRVLYAFRFHNKAIGYCQGLNRIGAIALLFLNEVDSFWFMVAFVEHLQPADYYTSDLACAVADQKVLLDIMREKLPKVDAHLRKLEVDLTPFTLSWFLTCFVDVLPHKLYIPIFDIFLYEGNKVIFRFALAILKLCEPRLLQCPSAGSIHGVLSNLGGVIQDYNELSTVAFTWLNPFPMKTIDSKRQLYLKEVMASHRA
uniref:PH domain-containing protein n=1 Tax=Steinernema glaseri TaxID=37863 RepID=A0A1I7YR05_9BILA